MKRINKAMKWLTEAIPVTRIMVLSLFLITLVSNLYTIKVVADLKDTNMDTVVVSTEPTEVTTPIEETETVETTVETTEVPTVETTEVPTETVAETTVETVPETVPETTVVETPKETKTASAEEYANATYIWNYLKEAGYNDYVISGIMGNMMAETAGGTLNIQAEIYDASGYFYGICQWNRGYCGEVHGRDLKGQLDYLMATIKKEYDTFGPAFNTSYEEFCNLQNEKQAALSFARVYERCASFSHGPRQSYATTALNYFT